MQGGAGVGRQIWLAPGPSLQPSVHPSRLLPSNALLLEAPSPQDSAQFECVANNEVGESRRHYQVTVQGESWQGPEMWVQCPPSQELSCQQGLVLASP